MNTQPLHITELHVQNFKRIEAFAVALKDGEPLILTGDNGAGKSSILDALFTTLTGDGLTDPVRRGASKATVTVKLADGGSRSFEIEKRITPKGRTLHITDASGAEIRSPQAFLDNLTGALAFDPLAFARMSGDAKGRRQQASIIRDLSGLDTSELDEQYRTTFAARTMTKRTFDERAAQFKVLPLPVVPERLELPEIAPVSTEEVEASASELIARRDAMAAARLVLERDEEEVCEMERDVERRFAEVVSLRERLAKLEEELATARGVLTKARGAVGQRRDATWSEAEVTAVTRQLADVDTVNAGIRQRRQAANDAYHAAVKQRDGAMQANHSARIMAENALAAYRAKEEELKSAEAAVDQLTRKLEAIESRKAAMAKAAKMPVPGMTFDESGVMVEGLPFDQFSTAEQIRMSVLIAMAANPDLRIILIREGALVNKKNLAIIFEAARERGYQVLIEKFCEAPEDQGLHIVDGSVVAIDGAPIATEQPSLL